MTEEVPYYRKKQEVSVFKKIMEKALPDKPIKMSDGLQSLWNICTKCWNHVVEHRATIREVSFDLSQIHLTIRERATFRPRKSIGSASMSRTPERSSSETTGNMNKNEREFKPKQPQTIQDGYTTPSITMAETQDGPHSAFSQQWSTSETLGIQGAEERWRIGR